MESTPRPPGGWPENAPSQWLAAGQPAPPVPGSAPTFAPLPVGPRPPWPPAQPRPAVGHPAPPSRWPSPPPDRPIRRPRHLGWLIAAVSLVVVSGLVVAGAQAQPGTSSVSGERPRLTAPGEQPGVPRVPVADHPTLEGPDSPDRQTSLTSPDQRLEFPEPPGGGVAGYAAQVIDWRPCEDHLCATVLAPLDWEAPDDRAITLALRKVPSADPIHGALFVNPGGPGYGGQEFVAGLEADLWSGFDLIGWDPRGTDESTRIGCGRVWETDAMYGLDASPDDEGEELALLAGLSDFARQCRVGSGDLLDHVSSIDMARDLDLLRHLAGEARLNYLGISYGTYIGAVYAELFGERVGRMVLDSAVTLGPVGQVAGTERFEEDELLLEFAQWCLDEGDCPLGEHSAARAMGQILGLLNDLEATPIPVDERELTQTLAATGIVEGLYWGEEEYPALLSAIEDAMNGDGLLLLDYADYNSGRGWDSYSAFTYAFPALLCADEPDLGHEAALASWGDYQALPGGKFSRHLGVGLFCEVWAAAPAPRLDIRAEDAPPVLVVGVTGDPVTPYQDSQAMADQLPGALLLTLEADYHGGVAYESECVDDLVGDFLLTGSIPDGEVCDDV